MTVQSKVKGYLMTSLLLAARVLLALLVTTCTQCGKGNVRMTVLSILNHVSPSIATAQPCFTSADDCFSGGTDPALTTYQSCCQPLLGDNTVRRSFVSNGRCFECIRK